MQLVHCRRSTNISRNRKKFSQNGHLVSGIWAPLLKYNAVYAIKRQRGTIWPKKEAEGLREEYRDVHIRAFWGFSYPVCTMKVWSLNREKMTRTIRVLVVSYTSNLIKTFIQWASLAFGYVDSVPGSPTTFSLSVTNTSWNYLVKTVLSISSINFMSCSWKSCIYLIKINVLPIPESFDCSGLLRSKVPLHYIVICVLCACH